jgi:hypothetical protein
LWFLLFLFLFRPLEESLERAPPSYKPSSPSPYQGEGDKEDGVIKLSKERGRMFLKRVGASSSYPDK